MVTGGGGAVVQGAGQWFGGDRGSAVLMDGNLIFGHQLSEGSAEVGLQCCT